MTPDPVPPARRDEGERYPAMCRDGHAEVRYGYDEAGRTLRDEEICPVCKAIVNGEKALAQAVAAAESAAFARGRAEGDAEQRKMLCRLERMIRAESEDVTYGGFPGGDPREFACDPECSTEEERAAHAADCAAWDAWEQGGKQGEPPAPSVKYGREAKQTDDGGVMVVKYAGYGLGTCRWVDDERRALADDIRALLGGADRDDSTAPTRGRTEDDHE